MYLNLMAVPLTLEIVEFHDFRGHWFNMEFLVTRKIQGWYLLIFEARSLTGVLQDRLMEIDTYFVLDNYVGIGNIINDR